MKYIAQPVAVDAFKIIKVNPPEDNGKILCECEEGKNLYATPGMTARYVPVAGDYFVIQSDGYVYVNPKDVFERKYRIDNLNA